MKWSAVVVLMLSGCSYVRTDGTRSTAFNVGGRGTTQAPGVSTAYNNDASFVALVAAAKRAIETAVITNGVKDVMDNHYDYLNNETAADVVTHSTDAQEAVRLQQLREETRQLKYLAD